MNITYDDKILTFEDGTTMPAPNAVIKKIEGEDPEYDLEVVHDISPINPYKEWDQLGTIVSWDPTYAIGDQPGGKKRAFFEDVIEGDAIYLDIYKSGRDDELSTDGGVHVGYIFVTYEDAASECVKEERVKDMLKAELATYNAYHMGNVWGYVIREVCNCCGDAADIVDSCFGFYGDDVKAQMLDYLQDWGVEDQFDEAWEARFD